MGPALAAVLFEPVAPPGRRHKVDPLTTALEAGDDVQTWGLHGSAHSVCQAALREPYEALAAAMREALGHAAGAYVIPFESLHITAGSPANFVSQRLPPEQVPAFEAAWLRLLREECVPGKNGFPDKPFPLVYSKLRLDAAAGIFLVDDPTGALSRIREIIARCAERPEVAPFMDLAAMRIPSIVHSTFLRFARLPAEGVTDAAIAAAFESVAAQWKPVTVMADALVMIREKRPYLHLELLPGGADADECVLAVFPYSPAN